MLLSCMNSIEKYLFEFNYMNPFAVLIYEGTIGFFLSYIPLIQQSFYYDFSSKIKKTKRETGNIVGFIFMLIAYIILSGGVYIFRLMTTKKFSPMVTTLAEYVLNPIYFIYFYFGLNDFKDNDKLDIPYFIVNIIISLIISFFGCVYNEFIILFFCGLEVDTYDQVSKRADIKTTKENKVELIKIEDDDLSIDGGRDSIIK